MPPKQQTTTTEPINLGGGVYLTEPFYAPLLRPATEFKPHPQNPRIGDIDALKASILDHGLYAAIHRQRTTGYTLKGNHTARACIELGAEQLPFLDRDVDDEEALVILARDNQVSELGGWDEEQLHEVFAILEEHHDDIAALGFPEEYVLLVNKRVEAGQQMGTDQRGAIDEFLGIANLDGENIEFLHFDMIKVMFQDEAARTDFFTRLGVAHKDGMKRFRWPPTFKNGVMEVFDE